MNSRIKLKDNFENEQKNLVKLCKKFKKHNINFLQSNSYCEENLKKYKDFNIEQILCKRKINAKNPNDTDYEILIS